MKRYAVLIPILVAACSSPQILKTNEGSATTTLASLGLDGPNTIGAACGNIPGRSPIDDLEIACGICRATPGSTVYGAFQCRNGKSRELPNTCVHLTPDACRPNEGHFCAVYGPKRDPNWTEYFYVGHRACIKVLGTARGQDQFMYAECQSGNKLRVIAASIPRDDQRCTKVLEPRG